MGGSGRALILHPAAQPAPTEPELGEATEGGRSAAIAAPSALRQLRDRRRSRRLPDRLLRGLVVDRLA